MTVERIFFLNQLLFKTFKQQFHKIQNVHNWLSNILIRFKYKLKTDWFRVDNIRSVNHCCFITKCTKTIRSPNEQIQLITW